MSSKGFKKSPRVASLVKVRRSKLSGKWAVDIDMPRGSRRLTVYYDRGEAVADAAIAAKFFGACTVEHLEDPDNWRSVLRAYGNATREAGLEDDDEVISRFLVRPDGLVVADDRKQSLDQENARLRELGLLSDRVWYRDRPVKPGPSQNEEHEP